MQPESTKTSIWRDTSRRWRALKNDWRMKTPKQKWLLVYNVGAKMSDLIGVTVYGDMKNYWYSYVPGIMGIIYFLTVFYTSWIYYVKGEIFKGMQPTCYFGIVISVS